MTAGAAPATAAQARCSGKPRPTDGALQRNSTEDELTWALFAGESGVAATRFAHGSGRATLNATASERDGGQALKSASTKTTIAPGGTLTVSESAPLVEPTS